MLRLRSWNVYKKKKADVAVSFLWLQQTRMQKTWTTSHVMYSINSLGKTAMTKQQEMVDSRMKIQAM